MRAFILCIAALSSTPVLADANIYIDYRVYSVRTRPKPVTGYGAASINIVLHDNGTADNMIHARGKNPRTYETTNRALGPQKSGTQYRVIDQNTIERTFDDKTHTYIVNVKVAGKTCTATVSYKLKPGQKDYEAFSSELGVMAHYSILRGEDVTCSIR